MSKMILFPTTSIINRDNVLYPGIKDLLLELHKDKDYIFLISRSYDKVQSLKKSLGSQFDFLKLTTRSKIKEVVNSTNSSHVILVGSNDVDLHLTVHKKMLLLNPLWSDVQEEKAVKYGLGIASPEKLLKIIRILNNQKEWFYELKVDDSTEVYSLTNANSYGKKYSDEVKLIEGFNRLLKKGEATYFEPLLFHFLASIINNPKLQDIDIWGIMPSSGTNLNDNMLEIKEKARTLMGKKNKKPLFIRHTKTKKSHHMDKTERLDCDRHFDTIIINPDYKKKLKGKTICILDDYLTNGTSFETIRNMLLHENVKKIIFISIGRFRRSQGIEYLKQDYTLSGDLYGSGFTYTSTDKKDLKGKFNDQADQDIKTLYEIINS